MGPIQVVVQDGNNLVLEVTPTPNTTVIIDRGIPGPVGPMGNGDVDGPASSTDNAVARFDGTTGKLIQNSLVTVSDTGAVAGVTTLAASGAVTLSGGTANGVTYLNGSKVLTSGSALTFDGTTLTAPRYQSTSSNAALPSYGVEAGSGIFNAGASTIGFSAGSTERMRLTATSLYTANGVDVGIGTTSPGAKLHIQSTSGFTPQIMMGQTSSYRLDVGYNNSAEYGFLQAYAASTSVYDDIAINPLGGNVGIGTSSPTQRLTVTGNAAISGSITEAGSPVVAQTDIGSAPNEIPLNQYLGNLAYQNASSIAGQIGVQAGTAAAPAITPVGNSNTGIFFPATDTIAFAEGGVEAMRINNAGNLGLGVTPSAWGANTKALQMGDYAAINSDTVNGAANVSMNAFFNGTNWIYRNSSWPASYYNQANGLHRWYQAASGTAGNAITFTQPMTLDASGNLLVGQTANGLQNSNSAAITPSAGNQVVLNKLSGSGSGNAYVVFGLAGTQIGSITQNGTTGVLYNITSDYRLKTVIGPVADAGQRIDALQPVEYTWNSDGSRTRGFLAHQFQEIYAGSVTGTKDAVDADGKPVYQSMQAGSAEVIADLVAEVKSLRQRLAAAGI